MKTGKVAGKVYSYIKTFPVSCLTERKGFYICFQANYILYSGHNREEKKDSSPVRINKTIFAHYIICHSIEYGGIVLRLEKESSSFETGEIFQLITNIKRREWGEDNVRSIFMNSNRSIEDGVRSDIIKIHKRITGEMKKEYEVKVGHTISVAEKFAFRIDYSDVELGSLDGGIIGEILVNHNYRVVKDEDEVNFVQM